MRRPIRYTVTALAAAVIGVGGTVLAMAPATASTPPSYPGTITITITVVEKGTSVNFVDVAPADSALGDQLIGTADLIAANGRTIGTSSFQGISTNVTPRTSELLTFVYELPDGKITTAGTARLSTSSPVFDEQFAITGGTGKYQNARGQVRVVQETVDHAEVTFRIRL
jgi:hypothetical protein